MKILDYPYQKCNNIFESTALKDNDVIHLVSAGILLFNFIVLNLIVAAINDQPLYLAQILIYFFSLTVAVVINCSNAIYLNVGKYITHGEYNNSHAIHRLFLSEENINYATSDCLFRLFYYIGVITHSIVSVIVVIYEYPIASIPFVIFMIIAMIIQYARHLYSNRSIVFEIKD